ncbi:bifunctional 4-hydroxy-2-oxoglutarate aldolase/2-dehydro-3-deoxy-phosphogluconate aldolase [Elongatibacter sediminis]|uniref:Bifunctional 4-hydroxy-2-oxoglutarate aldolase/2-dehydro-3-deoxy-phosphogluconate aldolase n=1 Tax=Elongatibacter sediminis TaxID=3119006 RepID=A0AAW9RCU7_9GAMM
MNANLNASLNDRLAAAPIVPLVAASDSETAVAITEALIAGGLGVIEVVLRSEAALDCLAATVKAFPQAQVGAGTVLTPGQARQVIDAGARFIVSPGLHEGVVGAAQEAGLPVYPGIATATELQTAWNLGLDTVKFFPAGLGGGVPMLKALSSVFRGVRFMPTGGVSAANLADFLAVPQVIACGGSWLTPAAAVAAGDFATITRLADEARAIASAVRP